MSRVPPPGLAAPRLTDGSLPSALSGLRAPVVWGVLLLVAIEGTIVALLVTSWFYLRLGHETWPPPGVQAPGLAGPTAALLLLAASPVPVWLGLRLLRRGRPRGLTLGLPLGLLGVAGYLGVQAFEYAGKEYLWSSHAYGSIDWTMSGYAAFHALSLLLAGIAFQVLALRGRFTPERHAGIQAVLLYWVFVAAASGLFWATQYLAPRW